MRAGLILKAVKAGAPMRAGLILKAVKAGAPMRAGLILEAMKVRAPMRAGLILEAVKVRAPMRAEPRLAVARAVHVGVDHHVVAADPAVEVGGFVNRKCR
jgi:hypothetical protein